MSFNPQPKPIKRKTLKGRKVRAESKVTQRIRALCVDRDGDCRLKNTNGFGPCGGESEWAHLGEKKRARTRGMAPEVRHTTAGSLMLCTRHHQLYDSGTMTIEPTTPNGADGLMRFTDKSWLVAC